jgi:hypothetical protein
MTRVRWSVWLGRLTGLLRMSGLLLTRRRLLRAILLMHRLFLRPIFLLRLLAFRLRLSIGLILRFQ